MRYTWLDEYLMAKPAVTKDFKKEWNWIRYFIGGKMFAAVLLNTDGKPYYINLKLKPVEGDLLRQQYEDIVPGYYSNKQHWNSIKPDGAVPDDLLKEIISPYFSTRVIRCPGGHMSWKGMDALDTYLDENNMASIDWNALNADAEGRKKDAQGLVDYAIKSSEGKEMVVLLMHDTYGKEETAKALPQIIKYFKDNGYKFKTLS